MKFSLSAILLVIALSASAQKYDSLQKVLSGLKGESRIPVLYELVIQTQRTDFEKMRLFTKESRKLAAVSSNILLKSYNGLTEGVFLNNIGKLDSSIIAFEQAKKWAREAGDTLVQIKAIGSLGRSLISAGRSQEALTNLFECLRLLALHPDKNDTEWRVRTNIAWAYLELKQYRECIKYGLDNLRLMKDKDLEWIAVYSYNNVAVALGALKKYDSAKLLIQKSISITEKSGDIFTLANAYFILGKIYAENNQPDLAVEQYLKAKPLREKVGNPSFIISDLYAISDLYYQMGNYKKGLESALEAIHLVEQYNLLLKFDGTYQALAKNYEGLGDYKNASQYYKLWALTKDSIYSKSHADAIAEMSTKYETEKKEQQLALQEAQLLNQKTLLQRTYFVTGAMIIISTLLVVIFILARSRHKRKQELALKERALAVQEAYTSATIESQENERKRVAQDLHDGMGQLISALRITVTNLSETGSTEDKLNVVEKSEKILNDMHKEVRSVAFNLMPQTLVQQGLLPALQEMAFRINETNVIRMKLSSFEMPQRLGELQEISIYRIVQEWTTNVIKYANATKLDVDLICDDDEIRVSIEDDGKGFDPSILNNTEGNGWKNILSRIGLLKGSVHLDSSASRSGSTLMLQIPRIFSHNPVLVK